MADGSVLDGIQDNTRQAGQRLRASYKKMHTKGMLDKDEYRQLEVRLSTALAMVEGVYSEARRHSSM
jgi:hypothetical protein